MARLTTRLVLKPTQRGARGLAARYGKKLVCVRYRYDASLRRRFKTVELIVEEREWRPADEVVGVRIEWHEERARRELKAAGGIWDPAIRLWRVRYGDVCRTDLSKRIVEIPPTRDRQD